MILNDFTTIKIVIVIKSKRPLLYRNYRITIFNFNPFPINSRHMKKINKKLDVISLFEMIDLTWLIEAFLQWIYGILKWRSLFYWLLHVRVIYIYMCWFTQIARTLKWLFTLVNRIITELILFTKPRTGRHA